MIGKGTTEVNFLSSNRTSGDKDHLLSNVALLYYGEGLTQGEIAKRLQVSRATIVNMLREGRERGIVDIRVDGRHLAGSSLSRTLKDKFGLTDVYVASGIASDGSPEFDRNDALPQTARVAATAIIDMVESGDLIGIAWGETIMAVATAMSHAPTGNVEVCQLIGSMISERVPASENCTIQIANKLDARCYTLHSPGIVSTKALADTIRREPTIQAQLNRLKNLDMTIASIGNMEPDTHLQAAGMASAAELQAARAAGAVGILCCRYIDAAGNIVDRAPQDRVIAADIENLRATRKKLLVVCGSDRLEATLAAIRGGLVTHLCVDEGLAGNLLEL